MTDVPVTWIFLRELAALVDGGRGDVACEGSHTGPYCKHLPLTNSYKVEKVSSLFAFVCLFVFV